VISEKKRFSIADEVPIHDSITYFNSIILLSTDRVDDFSCGDQVYKLLLNKRLFLYIFYYF